MSGKIYRINDDQTLSELVEEPYSNEILLQDLLEKYPDLLAGDQISFDQPRRWLFITREFPVPGDERGDQSGYLDHLFLDQDGIPTLIEVKRSSDTRIRREVVGQMLDYASNAVVYWTIERIQQEFESTCDRDNQDPIESLSSLLEVEPDSDEIDEFWENVKTNLQAGRIRMIFVADVIPASLQRIVEFLNNQLDPAEVIAIEVKQFTGDGTKTLVPRVIGKTAETQKKSSSYRESGIQWTPDRYYSELLSKKSSAEVSVAKAIEKWVKERGHELYWGRGKQDGGFVPWFYHKNIKHQIFAVYTYGVVEIYFQWYKRKPGFSTIEKRLELLSKLNQIPGITLDESKINSRPSIDLAILAEGDNLKSFLEIFNWFYDEVKKS